MGACREPCGYERQAHSQSGGCRIVLLFFHHGRGCGHDSDVCIQGSDGGHSPHARFGGIAGILGNAVI
jgi:hypothetical protein